MDRPGKRLATLKPSAVALLVRPEKTLARPVILLVLNLLVLPPLVNTFRTTGVTEVKIPVILDPSTFARVVTRLMIPLPLLKVRLNTPLLLLALIPPNILLTEDMLPARFPRPLNVLDKELPFVPDLVPPSNV